MIIILIYYNYCSVWKRSLDPSITLIGTFSSCCFSSENKLGLSILFCSFCLLCLVFCLFFLSFIPSHWKRKKRTFFFPSFVLTHSVSLDSSDERNIAHTHTWKRERRERESACSGQTDTRTRQVKELWYSARIFPKWLDHHYQKLAITTPRNKEMFKPHCLTGIFLLFFFFSLNVCHTERKRV